MRRVIAVTLMLGALSAIKPASIRSLDPQGGSFLFDAGRFSQVVVPGSLGTSARSINNAGQITGTFWDSEGSRGFLYGAGSWTAFDVPGAESTFPEGINNAGDIVGTFDDAGTRLAHGFLRSAGSFTSIDVPPANPQRRTVARSVNDAGQIVGSLGAYVTQGFLYSAGSFTILNGPTGTAFTPSGINNAGQIVGTSWDTHLNRYRGYMYDGGVFTPIDPFDLAYGAYATNATGINDRGQIVGFIDYGRYGGGLRHGFLYDRGSFTIFDVPGALDTAPVDINDAGQIVGFYGQIVPEPGSMLLLGSALLTIGAARLRK